MPTFPPAAVPGAPAPAGSARTPSPPGTGSARPFVAAVLVACLLLSLVPEALAEPAGPYVAPVEAPVVDGFRAPVTPYSAGNRGLDYATTPGQEVRAAADGEVTFAGRVGTDTHVVVLHRDGIRTSYSFLASAGVRRGEEVGRGQVVGTAGPVLHFGARAGDRYLDPSLLLAGAPVEVHLIPVELRRPASEAKERRWLQELVSLAWKGARAGAGTAGQALRWARDGAAESWEVVEAELRSRWQQLVVLAAYAEQLPIGPAFLVHASELWARASRFRDAQEGCTPASQPPPPPPPGRRIAVLVAGFGSSSAEADVAGVDTAALGYAGDDVVQFSYAGGRTPGVGAVAGVPVSDYRPEDSTGDLRTSGRRLRALLDAIADRHPEVPVDVIAHSQGGVVARLALGPGAAGPGAGAKPVENLITLGSPHHGADVATANALLGTTTSGTLAQAITEWASDGRVDGSSDAAAQLAETSALVAELRHRPLPAGTRVTSVAASGDLTVVALNSSLEGATNVLVPLAGPSAHGDLPRSETTLRELQLALGGRGPTCRQLADDLALAAGIGMVEDGMGLAVGVGAMWADGAVPGPSIRVRTPGPVGPATGAGR
ncbi:MAG: peptidoglycan DD-metalloendopeptidase family protein [Actinobacteria bacterium]|nr:peptidoglycan DD-metalloendopeptidase family protein [Actinomycetota bacterium]